jgi:hypothetical protein
LASRQADCLCSGCICQILLREKSQGPAWN